MSWTNDDAQRNPAVRRTGGQGWGAVAASAVAVVVVFLLAGWAWQVWGDRPFSDYVASLWVAPAAFIVVSVVAELWRRRRA